MTWKELAEKIYQMDENKQNQEAYIYHDYSINTINSDFTEIYEGVFCLSFGEGD